MLRFLFGIALGAGGFWAYQTFGRDLLGLGGEDQGASTTYGGFSDGSTTSSDATSGNPYGATTGGTVPGGTTPTPPSAT